MIFYSSKTKKGDIELVVNVSNVRKVALKGRSWLVYYSGQEKPDYFEFSSVDKAHKQLNDFHEFICKISNVFITH